MLEEQKALPVVHHCTVEELKDYLLGVAWQIAELADEERHNPMCYSDQFSEDVIKLSLCQITIREFYEKHREEIRAEIMMDFDENGMTDLQEY